MLFMRYISLDLELNTEGEGNTGRTTDIIEIGAVVFNAKGVIEEEKFSRLIQTGKPLNPFIVSLTTITDEQIAAQGVTFVQGFADFIAYCNKYNVSKMFAQWGKGDTECLKRQAMSHGCEKIDRIGYRDFDVKTVYQTNQLWNEKALKAGLSKAMNTYGMEFEGTQHRAVDDAYNTARIFIEMGKRYFKQQGSIIIPAGKPL